MINHISERLQIAQEIVDSIPSHEKEKIRELIEKVKSLQRELNIRFIRLDAAKRCAECVGGCCTAAISEIFDSYYLAILLFDLTEENRQKILKVMQQNDGSQRCSFLADSYCAIPEDIRPFICKIAFCTKFLNSAEVIGNIGPQLEEAFSALEMAIAANTRY